MDSPLSSNQGFLTAASETSSAAYLLERGIQFTRQGCYVEGVTCFVLARERLSADQMHVARVLDALIQSHASYLQAQQTLHIASKRFVEADAEQQTQLVALEELLPILREDVDRVPKPHTIAQPFLHTQKSYQMPQSPQLPSTDSSIEQSSLQPHAFPTDSKMLPALYVTCFGHFEVRRSGKPIVLCSSRNGQRILRYVVARPEYCATSDTLMALLWPEDQPEVAQNKLHLAICALRHSLNHECSCGPGGGYIVYKNRTYHLNPSVAIRTDVDEFLHYYQMGQEAEEEKVTFYEKACRLYTGPFLPEDMYVDWSSLQREQLNRTYLTICRVLADHYFNVKDYEQATKWAITILKENPCDEPAHRQLIQIYTAQGHRSEALQQYQRCERLLRQELRLQPMPETQAMLQTILTSETISPQQ